MTRWQPRAGRSACGFVVAIGLLMGAWLTSPGCYRPHYSGVYACDPRRGAVDCPEGFVCAGGVCAQPGATMDMAPAGACTAGGSLLVMARGAQLWACTGSFPTGGYASLCRGQAGSHVCGSDPRDDDLLSLLACDTLSGFYVAAAPITILPSRTGGGFDAMCDVPSGPGERALLGCGSGASALRLNGPDCHGLHHALRCPAASAGWDCSPTVGLSSAAHDAAVDPQGGALCCAPEPR